MTINDPALVTILVFLIAGLFLLQTLFILFFIEKVNRRVRRVDTSLIKISRRVAKAVSTTNTYLHQVDGFTAKLPALTGEVDSLLDRAIEKVRDVNQRAAREIHLSTAHIEETGRRIELALSQFTRQTSKVKKWIRYPGHCVSAAIHGALTGFKTYSSDSHSRQPATHYPDDEIFI